MSLLKPGDGLAQSDILSDATPFEGSNIDAKISNNMTMLDIWGTALTTKLILTTSPTDFTLPDVVIPDLGTYTIEKAYAIFAFNGVSNRDGSTNYNSTDSYVQVDKAAAGYINAVLTPNNTINIAASSEESSPLVIVGSFDISSRVDNNATTNFKWTATRSSSGEIWIYNVRSGIRLIVRPT